MVGPLAAGGEIKAVVGILDALQLDGGVNHAVGTADKRFLVQANPLVIEDPHAFVLVGVNHSQRVHDGTPKSANRRTDIEPQQ